MRAIRSLPIPPGGGATGLNTPYLLSESAIPFIHISSGTIGNNGALSAVTTLDKIYTTGAYCLFPAGAIAAGIPAAPAWYWVTFSSTTAGTIWNSTWSGNGTPTPGTQTAFVTTGPGAYTGSTTETVAVSLNVFANSMGTQGGFFIQMRHALNNSAGVKNHRVRFGGIGGTAFVDSQPTTSVRYIYDCHIVNAGATNAQYGYYAGVSDAVAYAISLDITSAVDTTAATTLVLTLNKATATDFAIWKFHRVFQFFLA